MWPQPLREQCIRAELAIEESWRLLGQANQVMRQSERLRRAAEASIRHAPRRSGS